MIIVKGTNVSFDLEDKRKVYAPRGHGMMHDPSGGKWPKNSVLIGAFRKSSEPVSGGGAVRDYFGREYEARKGTVNLPPRKLAGWREVGEVERIWYDRAGTKYPGHYKHKFNGGIEAIFGKKSVRLYKLGSFYRLQLPAGCILDDRGFVSP